MPDLLSPETLKSMRREYRDHEDQRILYLLEALPRARFERDAARRELAEIDAALDAVTRCEADTRAARIRDSFAHNKLVTETVIFDSDKAEQSTRAQCVYWMSLAKTAAEDLAKVKGLLVKLNPGYSLRDAFKMEYENEALKEKSDG